MTLELIREYKNNFFVFLLAVVACVWGGFLFMLSYLCDLPIRLLEWLIPPKIDVARECMYIETVVPPFRPH